MAHDTETLWLFVMQHLGAAVNQYRCQAGFFPLLFLLSDSSWSFVSASPCSSASSTLFLKVSFFGFSSSYTRFPQFPSWLSGIYHQPLSVFQPQTMSFVKSRTQRTYLLLHSSVELDGQSGRNTTLETQRSVLCFPEGGV